MLDSPKIVKKQGAIIPFQFFRQLNHHTFPQINFNIFLPANIQVKFAQVPSGASISKLPIKSPFYKFHFHVLPHWATSFEICHMFINTLLKLVGKYCLKWFIQVIHNWSNLIAFICFVLFCVAGKVNIF